MGRFEPRTRWEAVQALFLYFLLYSVIGWAYEVFLEVVVYRDGLRRRVFSVLAALFVLDCAATAALSLF